jgi:hypothetical protein
VPKSLFEKAHWEFKRAMEAHARRLHAEMERARDQIHAAMEQARADMDRERIQFEELLKEVRRQSEGSRDWSRPEDWVSPPKRRRRPRRKPPGGEPAPVKPRPNPTPLVDGAEAPIE